MSLQKPAMRNKEVNTCSWNKKVYRKIVVSKKWHHIFRILSIPTSFMKLPPIEFEICLFHAIASQQTEM